MNALWLSLLHAAFAAEPNTVLVETANAQTDVYAFALDACEGVRAEVPDSRPMAERSTSVIVDLVNQSTATCTWTGLALKGWIDGTYSANRKNAADDGFTLAPGDAVRIRIKLRDAAMPRDKVQLQIPPGRGYVLLIGVEPPPPPAPSTTPQPAPAAAPAKR
jgi:hypothetical protein